MGEAIERHTYVGGPRDGEVGFGGYTSAQDTAVRKWDPDGYQLYHTYIREGDVMAYKGLHRICEGGPPKPPPKPVAPEDSPALRGRSQHYPQRFGQRVPRTVRLTVDVGPDPTIGNFCMTKAARIACSAPAGTVCGVTVNRHGAVTAILPGYWQIGLRPDEFEVVEYHPVTEDADAETR